MRNLIRLFVTYHPLLLFAVLEILSFFLLGKNDDYYQAKVVNASNAVTGSVYKQIDNVTSYFGLRRVNDSLASEMAELLNRPQEIVLVNSLLDSCGEITDTIREVVPANFTYIPAKVIKNTVTSTQNFIFLDKGRRQGVDMDMAVVSPKGVVGIVTRVSENYSMAMSLIHKDAHISARLLPGAFFGSLSWDKQDIGRAVLQEIPSHANPQPGDEVVTSGFSSIFPENVPIGKVIGSKRLEASNFLEVDVALETDFSSLQHVMVIAAKRQSEIRSLESSLSDE